MKHYRMVENQNECKQFTAFVLSVLSSYTSEPSQMVDEIILKIHENKNKWPEIARTWSQNCGDFS